MREYNEPNSQFSESRSSRGEELYRKSLAIDLELARVENQDSKKVIELIDRLTELWAGTTEDDVIGCAEAVAKDMKGQGPSLPELIEKFSGFREMSIQRAQDSEPVP